MPLPFWTICFAGFGGMYLMLLWMHRKPDPNHELNHLLALLGAGAVGFGMFGFAWVALVGKVIPTKITDPAIALTVLTAIASFLTVWFSGLLLLMSSSGRRWRTMPPRDKYWARFGPIVLALCLLMFPLLRIPQGSLVADNGKIVPFGSSYRFVPGIEPKLVGFNNPVSVGVSRHVKSAYYGEKRMSFSAKVYLHLSPGDLVSSGLTWVKLQWAVLTWFDQQLDDRYQIEPTKFVLMGGHTIVADEERDRNIGQKPSAIIEGVLVFWDGSYSFREE